MSRKNWNMKNWGLISNMEKYIYEILLNEFQTKDKAIEVYNKSELLQYFNLKSNAIYGNVKNEKITC